MTLTDLPAPVLRRPKRQARLLEVIATRRLTPNMIRITLGGPELANLAEVQLGVHCKLVIPDPGEDAESLRARAKPGNGATIRTYTIREFRKDPHEIDIDFAVHGDKGPANLWSQRARPGDPIAMLGPGVRKFQPDGADFYLLGADMTALPLIGAVLEQLPRDARGQAIIEIASPEDRQEIDAPEGVEITWALHPHPETASPAQLDFLKAIDWPEGRVQTCIAGETGTILALRDFAREKGVANPDIYASGYWTIGLREDEHQEKKRAMPRD